MKTIAFNKEVNFYADDRPYADVKIISGTIPTNPTVCLVDTGADYLQLPEDVGIAAGLSFSTAATKSVKTSSGSVANYRLVTDVDVEIEGKKIKTAVMFGPANCMCLVGRIALLSAFDIGFDTGSWLCNP
jgi:predicted aspartyl protease